MEEEADSPRRGRRLITLLAVAGALAAVPAGVALAGGSDGSTSSGSEGQSGATTIQQEAQPDGERPDRGDCPEKDGQGGQDSSEQDTTELDTTQL